MSDFAFTCPFCKTELSIPDKERYYTCDRCGRRLNLESQYAFLRGMEAFEEGQETMQAISPKRRKKREYNPDDRKAMDLFLEAYTSLQIAFRAELAEVQRVVGVEMMANMAAEFVRRSMISPLETSYWGTLLVLQNVQTEYDQLKEKLGKQGSALGFVQRLYWRSRQNQLRAALAELERRLAALESQISFVEMPQARNKSWAP